MKNLETILVVEDSISIGEMLEEMLGTLGYRVYISDNGIDALELLEVFHVDLILTDLRMPEMSGVALYREVRRQGKDIPFILMSGYAGDFFVDELVKGGELFMPKPFNISELLEVITTRWQLYCGEERSSGTSTCSE